MVSSCSVNPRQTVDIDSIGTLSSILWCWIWATRFCRCLGNASSSHDCLRNNDPSQRPNYYNRVGRCKWWCASNRKPCNIVSRVVGSRAGKSGALSGVSVVDACVVHSVRMRPFQWIHCDFWALTCSGGEGADYSWSNTNHNITLSLLINVCYTIIDWARYHMNFTFQKCSR